MKGIRQLLFDERLDCPICLEQFTEPTMEPVTVDDQVIQLPCSNKHIYHKKCQKKCIQEYLDYNSGL